MLFYGHCCFMVLAFVKQSMVIVLFNNHCHGVISGCFIEIVVVLVIVNKRKPPLEDNKKQVAMVVVMVYVCFVC